MPSHGRICPRFCYFNIMKFPFLGFHAVVLVKTFPLITNVGLISTKPGRFLFSEYGQNSISSISNFEKKIPFFFIPYRITREDFSIDVSITNVGLILTKPGLFLFWGYGQTDTVLESSHGNMSAHKKFQLKSSKLVVSCRSLYASPEDGDA